MKAELERHHRASFGWAMTCCRRDRDEASEVLQASYVKILDGQARFEGRSEFRTWLFGVIRRTAMEHRRRRARRERGLLGWFRKRSSLPRLPDPDPSAEHEEIHRRLRSHLERLSTRQRDLLHLVFYQDLTIEQAAGVLDIPLGTARTHYARGKAQLKKRLLASGDSSWQRTTMTTGS